MFPRTLVPSIVSGLMAIAVQPMPAVAATPSLAGSWQFTLTANSQPTPPVVPIPGLATFTTDGSVIETDGSEFVPNPSAATPLSGSTPGHGIWQIANTPETLFVQYISLVLNTDGSLYARNITTMFVTLNNKGNQFSGSYTTDQAIGTVTKVLSTGTVSGTLIPHVPLP
ncbi:MAG: hypothetical protein ABSC93_25345 [Bryobacteraceae bacterium]|jgi:hypothetical protein